MFIRTKKIKGQSYAYLAKNTWRGNSSRQQVIAYLGKVHHPESSDEEFKGELAENYKDSIIKLIKWRLQQCGFREDNGQIASNNIIFDNNKLEIKTKTTAPAVIKSFDGYICNQTLKELYECSNNGYDEEVGKRLAKSLIKAGMKLSKETFIQLFSQLEKNES